MNKFVHNFLIRITDSWLVWVIEVNRKPYLERYKLAGKNHWFNRLRRWLGLQIYIHRFVSTDGERWIHDHPWRWCLCFVLSGGYIEERLKYFSPNEGLVTERVPVRWLNLLTPRTFHRIAELKPNTWTLVICGPDTVHNGKRKGWGFIEAINSQKMEEKLYWFQYQQPYQGERTNDFMDNMPTGQQHRKKLEQHQ